MLRGRRGVGREFLDGEWVAGWYTYFRKQLYFSCQGRLFINPFDSPTVTCLLKQHDLELF